MGVCHSLEVTFRVNFVLQERQKNSLFGEQRCPGGTAVVVHQKQYPPEMRRTLRGRQR